MPFLENKYVLVTGTSRGIGKAIIEKLASEGANLYAHARKFDSDFESFLDELSEKYSVKLEPLYFDLTDTDEMKRVIRSVLQRETSLDALVNNAGITQGGLFGMTSIQTVREVFEVNLFSSMELTQLVLRKMIRQKSGCIVNMSSVAALHVRPGNSAYGVSKAAVKAWTETLAAEVAQNGIRVNAVAPGLTETDMADFLEEKSGENILRESAMERLATPEEIANAVAFLISDDASFINGHTLVVNGGGDGD